MIKCVCPGCSAVFAVGDEKAGNTEKCPNCSATCSIPDAFASGSTASSTSTKTPVEPAKKKNWHYEADNRPRPQPRGRNHFAKPLRSRIVTALGGLNYVLGGLGFVSTILIFIAINNVEELLQKQYGQVEPEDVQRMKSFLFAGSVFNVIASMLLIVTGYGVVNRHALGRRMVYILSFFSLALTGLCAFACTTTFMAGDPQRAMIIAGELIFFAAYGLFSIYTTIKYRHEFD